MHSINYLLFLVLAGSCQFTKNNSFSPKESQPNLLIIQTDEHNFRTLGCYREQLSHAQAFIWGDSVNVETPNIDWLATNGILFTKYYAATPVCSPSRGSFIAGMYPQHTGVPINDVPLNDDIITFSEVLLNNGYKTGFIGKWHLDGEGKPQWGPERKFGFADNKYMFNRGHWKKMENTADGPRVAATNEHGEPNYDLDGADEKSFTTDFLTDRSIEFMNKNRTHPFSMYLSYPDPHSPDKVRPPYDEMYKGMAFQAPVTYHKSNKGVPSWASKTENAGLDQSQYFGMIKCIDDNIGEILDYLRHEKLIQNTIIVFTSDHGDLRAEHHRDDKEIPLEGSAKVPFIIYYPQELGSGVVIKNAFNTVDFAPTILGLMNQSVPASMQGHDFSDLLLNPSLQSDYRDITFMRSIGLDDEGTWTAAVTSRYKLILSKKDEPWLIDMAKDPNELVNFISEPENKELVRELAVKLQEYADKFNDKFLKNTKMANDLKELVMN